MNAPEVNRETAAKVVAVVKQGLVRGVGRPVPGQMCVEAAVCYAMGLPHGDNPPCVAPALRSLKIALNDSPYWSSPEARARGMLRLSIVQLGTAGTLNQELFAKAVADMTIRSVVPTALRFAALVVPDHKDRLEAAAGRCEKEGTREAALKAKAASASAATWAATWAAASAASDAAAAATWADAAAAASARDKILGAFAEGVVQILVSMNVPGAAWLDLAPL